MREPSPDKQEAILETALRLFTERGFAGTPTSLISKEAGVATGTLFFYFKTKEELIDTLYRRVKSEAAQAMGRGLDAEKTAKDKFCRLGKNAAGWGIRNPAKLKFMEQFAHSPFVSTSAHEEGMSHFLFLEELVRQGIRDGEIRNVEPSGLFCLMASALSGMIAHALSTDDRKERERIIEDGLDFIWFGMKA
ncbi:TetR/AcrR family transcriptional regulator [Methanoregula formicica]|uniref:Transcriptional regulator n=1 Tax=Methanoregula formicica (strain DSM 22288 / NBRC 105244 / SMSP) TaxID=593750 RepID=L0HGE6_METFS|nr:TetR/AcrR family transcriptional regulator [Methanoregula formicica]AGB03807.1 transcriptional regulator [Methanoregula formicica SMSP]